MNLALPLLVMTAIPAEVTTVWNLEPTREHPRNSEGSFVTLRDGRVLFGYTEFVGGAADESPARLVARVSADGGVTWSEPREMVPNEGGANVMSVSLLRLRSGRMALFYLKKNNWLDCHPYVRFSTDEGATWSAPTPVTSAPGYFVLNNDRVIQLTSGRLVVPLAFHRSRGGDPHSARSFDSRALALWYLSDDEGATWREARTWWALPVVSGTGLQEPGAVELPDGALLTMARTDQGYQAQMRSVDQGENWSAPVPGPLSSPVSPASLKRVPGTSQVLAIWNNLPTGHVRPHVQRTALVSAVSDDCGRTWQHRKLLELDADACYCYTAIHFVGEYVLLAYCAGDSKVGGLNRLRIRRVRLDWLREGP